MSADRRGSYISSQLIVIDNKLQLLYDEIGISEEERNSRERYLYSAVAQALEQQVNEVTAEKEHLVLQCVDFKKRLDIMMQALNDDPDRQILGFRDIAIKPPLMATYQRLKEQHDTLEKTYSQRYERVQGEFFYKRFENKKC